MSEKLKPCPFCGGEAREKGHKGVGTAIQCTVCGANSGIRQRSRKESAEAWNSRPEPRALTLDELQQMDGQPVYSEKIGWGIVGKRERWDENNEKYFRTVVGYPYGWEWLDDVMRHGPIYDRPPGGEENV
jgi:Lar family restriction alleviation protein